MTRTILSFVFFITLVGLLAFTWNGEANSFDHLLDDKSKSERLFTTDSDALTNNLAAFFAPVMDRVERVDAHRGEEKDYYFSVYGKKNGKALVRQVLVSEEMACNQEFPTLAQMGIESGNVIVYCYWETINIGPLTISICKKIDNGVVCGVSPSGDLCVLIDEVPRQGL